MSVTQRQRFFFIHIMKTGGTTFCKHIRANFGPGSVYPDKTVVPDMSAYLSINRLANLSAQRKASVRAYMGHFPFVTTQLLPGNFVTLTLLRDPVERTISYLKHCRRLHKEHQTLTLEEIYEDPFFAPRFIHNYQTRIFAMTPRDVVHGLSDAASFWSMQDKRPDLRFAILDIDTGFNTIEVDSERLAIAKANLAKVDILGLTEEFDAFVETVRSRFNWRIIPRSKWFVGERREVSSAFRRRVAEDNAMDMAFYEYAQRLYRQRNAQSTPQ